jgi:hypothetical protein
MHSGAHVDHGHQFLSSYSLEFLHVFSSLVDGQQDLDHPTGSSNPSAVHTPGTRVCGTGSPCSDNRQILLCCSIISSSSYHQ